MSERDLLSKTQKSSSEDEDLEVELDLSLSLNGRFGANPLAKTRSLSIPDFVVNDKSGLNRSFSLPVETKEEWRKRKELESLRRLEAKRKRSEKVKRNVRVFMEIQKVEGEGEGEEKILEEGSIGSSGSGSSGLSEVDIVPTNVQGPSKETSPSTAQSQPTNNQIKEPPRNIIEDMPCVSTIGDGPNGKKIDGFLYRYRKGDEVKIVCVCHGSFLSPAEFVKHAGGGDVAYPLKHIVVNPSSPFL